MPTKTLRSLFVLLALATALAAQQIVLPKSARAPVVDGKFSAEEYAQAVQLAGAMIPLQRGWRALLLSPDVYLTRDDERLYLCCVSPLREGEYPKSNVFLRDASMICTDPSVEWFITPPVPEGEDQDYYHFIGNARAVWYDSRLVPAIGQGFTSWNGNYHYRTSVAKDHWVAEISLPLADVGIDPAKADGAQVAMEFARDGGFAPQSYARAFHRFSGHVPVRLVDGVPAVQVLDFGDFANRQFNPRLRLVGTGKEASGRAVCRIHDTRKQLLAEEGSPWTLPADGRIELPLDIPLEKDQEGEAELIVTTADGAVLFARRWDFKAAPRDLQPVETIEIKPLVVQAFWAPSYGKVHVLADIFELKRSAPTLVDLEVLDPDGRVVGTATVRQFTSGGGTANLDLGGKMRGGTWTVRGIARSVDGEELARDEAVFERRVYDWEGSPRGLEEKVLPPWTPVAVRGDTLSVWGRDYRLGPLGLPAAIRSLQPEPTRGPAERQLLSRPVEIVAISDGRRLEWRTGGCEVLEAKPTGATIGATATAPGLDYSMVGKLDYDGFYRVDLTFQPREIPLESLYIEVPLPGDVVRLLHSTGDAKRKNNTSVALPATDGLLWDSASAARNMIVPGNFLPYLWIGDEDRGIAWTANSPRTWELDPAKPVLEVIRRGDEALLRVHLVNKPGVCQRPIIASFGLHATPVRRRLPGGSWRQAVNFRVVYWGRGMKRFGPPGAFPKENEWAALQALSEEWRQDPKHPTRLFAYQNYSVEDTRMPEAAQFKGEWMKLPGYKNKTHVRSAVDWELWCYRQWYDRCQVTGQYLDVLNVGESANPLNGIGYRDDDGDLLAGCGIFEGRNYFRRLAHWLDTLPENQDEEIRIFTHMTAIANVSMIGWSGCWMNGELSGFNERNVPRPDSVDLWGHDRGLGWIRAGAIGRQYGVIPLWCTGYPEMGTVFGLHDVPHRWGRADPYRNLLGREVSETIDMWAADLAFLPYWRDPAWYRVTRGGRLLATAWSRDGKARIHVANLEHRDVDAALELDLAALGVAGDCRIVRETDGRAVPHQAGNIPSLPIAYHKYEVLVLGPAAGFGPGLDAADVAALNTGKRLDAFTEDFNDPLGEEWTWDASAAPRYHDRPAPPASHDIYYQALRIRSTGGHAHMRRALGRDAVSIRVKIYRPDGQQGGNPGLTHPMAAVYWGPRQYVKFAIENTDEAGQTMFVARRDGRPPRQTLAGPAPARVNWCRFDLRPETVDCHLSTDGKTWQQVGSFARDRNGDGQLVGAPAHVILGIGFDADDSEFMRGHDRGIRDAIATYDHLIVEELE